MGSGTEQREDSAANDSRFGLQPGKSRLPVVGATFELTTPLFGGGANPVESPPEMRAPSFKGVLRWWWRALAWSRYDGDLELIHKTENRVFGSASTGRSRVLIRLNPRSDGKRVGTVKKGEELKCEDGGIVGPGVRYLGYGLIGAFGDAAGRVARPCLREGITVDVELRLRDLERDEVEHLRDALVALGTMGGLGARSRRGFGSLALRELSGPDSFPEWEVPKTAQELESVIKSLLPNNSRGPVLNNLPPYSALTSVTDFVIHEPSRQPRSALVVLNEVGEDMMLYRSWGRNGRVLGKESEKNFCGDHGLMERAAGGQRVTEHPRRVVFGLPHNYYFSNSGNKADVAPADDRLDRRASPLLVHVHSFEDRHAVVLTVMPSVFLPPGRSRLSVGSSTVNLAQENLYAPLAEFIDRFRPGDGGESDGARNAP